MPKICRIGSKGQNIADMTEQTQEADKLHTMEIPLIASRSAAPTLCIYYSHHLDPRKPSWTRRTKDSVIFRAVSIKEGSREFYMDKLLWSLGFMIQVNIIERILLDYHEETTQNPKS